MPLYEMEGPEILVPFRQVHGGAELYEREIEDLLWSNFEEFVGEQLFRIARQARIESGIPDIIALDATGHVVVIEVKRDVDRGQMAQCLEYAGWARKTNLDELARLYHRGDETFFSDWQTFTDSTTPVMIQPKPRLMLVAREFHHSTQSALDFLIDNKVPVKLVTVAIYQDAAGRKFVDVSGEHEPDFSIEDPGAAFEAGADPTKIDGRRVQVPDLLDAGLVKPGQELTWNRPRVGETYRASVTETGQIRLEDGRECSSPSNAAMTAANVASYDGWYAWRVNEEGDQTLHKLRVRLAQQREAATTNPAD